MSDDRKGMLIAAGIIVMLIGGVVFFNWRGSLVSAGAHIARGEGQIAYLRTSYNAGGWDLYILDTVNDKNIQLTLNQKLQDAEWTPDGESMQLRYADGTLGMLNVTTGELGPLAVFGHISPDGNRVLFDDNETPHAFSQKSSVIIANRDGSDRKTLANGSSPAWSPDGGRIAFESRQEGDRDAEIYVMDADGGNLKKVVEHEGIDNDPIWSPNGKYIYFTVLTTNDPYADGTDAPGTIVDVATGAMQTTIKSYYNGYGTLSWQPDNSQVAFLSSDGSVMCWYRLGNDGGSSCSNTKTASLAFNPAQEYMLAYQQNPGSTICLKQPAQQVHCFDQTNSGDFTYITPLMWRP